LAEIESVDLNPLNGPGTKCVRHVVAEVTAVGAYGLKINESAHRRGHSKAVPYDPFVSVKACGSDSDLGFVCA
jgi:hypothetical protein